MTRNEKRTLADRRIFAHALLRARGAWSHGDRTGALIAQAQADAALRRILDTTDR